MCFDQFKRFDSFIFQLMPFSWFWFGFFSLSLLFTMEIEFGEMQYDEIIHEVVAYARLTAFKRISIKFFNDKDILVEFFAIAHVKLQSWKRWFEEGSSSNSFQKPICMFIFPQNVPWACADPIKTGLFHCQKLSHVFSLGFHIIWSKKSMLQNSKYWKNLRFYDKRQVRDSKNKVLTMMTTLVCNVHSARQASVLAA